MDENMDDLSVGVLAGGKSSRMGRDKVFLKIGEKTFIEHICEELSCFGELLISCRDPEKFSALGYATVTDERDGFGPLEGIRQLIRHAACDDIFICAVDMPFISKELVEFLWKKRIPDLTAYPWFVAKTPSLCVRYTTNGSCLSSSQWLSRVKAG